MAEIEAYSPGPNPHLGPFVRRAARPYQAEGDDYEVGPFADELRATKATALYRLHPYWSKKPHSAVRRYIQHYTRPGDLVLDPFCGAGGTALMALALGRKALAIDLSPAATFIANEYCTSLNLEKLERAFAEAMAEIGPELGWLYETRCDRCGGRAITLYVVHSDLYRCPKGWEPVALYDCRRVLEGPRGRGRRLAWVCPEHGERIDLRGRRLGMAPVEVAYRCLGGGRNSQGAPCQPAESSRSHRDDDPLKREYFQRYDLGKMAELEAQPIPYWYPKDSLPAKALSHRLAQKGITSLDGMFTKRNLWACALFLDTARRLTQGEVRSALELLLSGCLLTLSRLYKAHHPGMLGSFYHLPHLSREANAQEVLSSRFATLRKAKAEIKALLQDTGPESLLLSTQPAQDLSAIPDSSIDYIFTDPPYGSQVQFWELNLIWECWLGFATSWHGDELVVNEHRSKTGEDWSRIMGEALAEMARVLKPGRWLTLCYHDTSPETWERLRELGRVVGLAMEETERPVAIDSPQKSYKQRLTGEKTLGRDLVVNLRKPKLWPLGAGPRVSGGRSELEKEGEAAEILACFLAGREAPVPYSDLFEHYLYAVKDKPRREFAEILADRFIPTASGWRNPDSDEQARLATSRESGLTRRLRRFLRALEEGERLPPQESPDNETLAAWLHHAYQSGLWEEGRRIFEQGGIDLSAFSEERRYEIQEDYETCLMMCKRQR